MAGALSEPGQGGAASSVLPAHAAILTVALLLMAPVLRAPTTRAIGRQCSEAPAHLWGLWVAAEGLFDNGPLVRHADVGFPAQFTHHLIDPAHLLVFAPVLTLFGGGAAAATLAWNGLHLVAVVGGGLGCVALGRRLGLLGYSLAIFTTVFIGSPAVLHHPEMGRSEYLPALALPWVLAWIWDAMKGPSPTRPALAAGLLLGLMASSGPTLALFTAPVVGVLALVWSRTVPTPRRVGTLAMIAMPGLAGAAVALGAMLTWPPPQAAAMLSGQPRELVSSMELASLVHLGPPMRDLEHTLYIGIFTLALALLGLVRAPRRVLPWALLATLLVSLGVGPSPTLLGQPLAGPNRLLTWAIPSLHAVSGWPRAAWVAALPLGVCAAIGATHLGRALRWLGPLLVVALLTDHASWPPPREGQRADAHFEVAAPDELITLSATLPQGPLFTLPARTPATGVRCAYDGPWLLWAQTLRRPVSANQGRPSDGLDGQGWMASRLIRNPERLARDLRRSRALTHCVPEQLQILQSTGVVAIVVDERLPRGGPSHRALEMLLGPPTHHQGAVSAWELHGLKPTAGPDGPPAVCPN